MNILDIIFLFIILGFTFIVYQEGFVKEIFSKLAFIVGCLIAIFFSPYFALTVLKSTNYVKNNAFLKNDLFLCIASFLFLFTIIFLIIKIIGNMVGLIFDFPILKSLDRSLGAILGLVEGSIIICIVIQLMQIQSIFSTTDLIANSKIASFFISHILPNMESQIQNYIK